MTRVVGSADSFIIPASLFVPDQRTASDSRETYLRKLLQTALEVEFATIPPYLTAMYSIKDKTTQAYQVIRSVVMEEMLHLNLASNLLLAVGGKPTLVNGNFPPKYPTHLSEQARDRGPYLQLMAASRQLIRETFMKIEQPAQPDAPAQGDKFSTIGQLYLAIIEEFKSYKGGYATEKQSTDWNIGNNGGTVIKVVSKDTALQAINEITEQGEGADVARTLDPQKYQMKQPWGQYEYYGPRVDGTYGPVLGTPLELSHYFKFKALADGTMPLPETYPMAPNPKVGNFKTPLAVELGNLFNGFYSIMVDELQIALQGSREGDRERFFTTVLTLMRTDLPALAAQLMRIPTVPEGSASLGPTAGPPFEYHSSQSRATVADTARTLAEEVAEGRHDNASPTLAATLCQVAADLSEDGR